MILKQLFCRHVWREEDMSSNVSIVNKALTEIGGGIYKPSIWCIKCGRVGDE